MEERLLELAIKGNRERLTIEEGSIYYKSMVVDDNVTKEVIWEDDKISGNKFLISSKIVK